MEIKGVSGLYINDFVRRAFLFGNLPLKFQKSTCLLGCLSHADIFLELE